MFNGNVMVANKGEIIYQQSYGYANFERDIKNTPNTKFRLASITKQFTAMLVMLAVQDGKLNINKAITHYERTICRRCYLFNDWWYVSLGASLL